MLKRTRKHVPLLLLAVLAVTLAGCDALERSAATSTSPPEPGATRAAQPVGTPSRAPQSAVAGEAPALERAVTNTTPTPVESPPDRASASEGIDSANFTLLISDERNAIGDFEHLWVTIDRVGLRQGGESGGWLEIEVPEDLRVVDLVALQGAAAAELISTSTSAGVYSKVFIHVSGVSGDLRSGTTTSVKLPSGKLQINKPFEVSEGSVTSFVFDITVIAAGNERSGVRYILKPVIGQSGAEQPFTRVRSASGRGEKRERGLTRAGRLEPGATSTQPMSPGNGPRGKAADADTHGLEGRSVRAEARSASTTPARLAGSETNVGVDHPTDGPQMKPRNARLEQRVPGRAGVTQDDADSPAARRRGRSRENPSRDRRR